MDNKQRIDFALSIFDIAMQSARQSLIAALSAFPSVEAPVVGRIRTPVAPKTPIEKAVPKKGPKAKKASPKKASPRDRRVFSYEPLILSALSNGQVLTAKELAQFIDANPKTLGKTLERLAYKGALHAAQKPDGTKYRIANGAAANGVM